MAIDQAKVEEFKRRYVKPKDVPFKLGKLGHIVINCADLERSLKFYTEIMGFEVSDIYTSDMAPGGMAFLRCGPDHHSLALVGSMEKDKPSDNYELNHIAFEVASLDEVLEARAHLEKHKVPIDFEGRRRAGVQIAVEFRDPDNHRLEIFWGLDQVASGQKARPRDEWKWAHSLEEAIQNPVRGQDTRLRNPTLMRKLSAKALQQQKQHSLETQAK
ncbi:MAG: VOC family protein, partial [Alphaproteobacteria bacterium]|nr:VOC family protein [Alphaproteobacteria bacterium]